MSDEVTADGTIITTYHDDLDNGDASHYRDSATVSLNDSPVITPSLFAEDYDASPATSSGLLTPPSYSLGPNHPEPILVSAHDHARLNAMSQEASSRGGQVDGYGAERRATYTHGSPLLLPHTASKGTLSPHKLQDQKGWSRHVLSERLSPPSTPKGHPLTHDGYFASAAKVLYPISRPKQAPKAYTTTFSWLLRVPRRFRPVLLLGFCLFSFALMYFTRDPVLSAQVEMAEQAAMAGRRFVESAIWDQAIPVTTPSAPNVEMSKEDEYAALISFITSTTSNSLPPLDPTKPLEPSIVLDFDPSGPNAREDLDLLKAEIHTLYPLVLFGRMRDPWHREVVSMLSEHRITPAPLLVDVDQRKDHAVFAPLLARLLDSTDLPQLMLGGKSLGSYHDVLALREQGTLKSTLEAQGSLSVRDAKKRKKGVKERERLDNERLLAPAPIVDGS